MLNCVAFALAQIPRIRAEKAVSMVVAAVVDVVASPIRRKEGECVTSAMISLRKNEFKLVELIT